jgi:hypothetical protein
MHRVALILNRKIDPSAPARSVFYDLIRAGRIEILHVGRTAYCRETWAEIVERLNGEDRAAGVPMPVAAQERLAEKRRRQREAEQATA